jgi:RpiR family transcriptional regulator, carbohydrate utilization regulator
MLERLQANLSQLTPCEQRVARLALQWPRRFTEMPVNDIAALSNVSKPTVIRFCRSMGYDGLTDFKLKLVGTISEGVPYIHRSVDADDEISDIAVKVIDAAANAFLSFRKRLKSDSLYFAVDTLYQTHSTGGRIEIYGVGNSGVVAMDAQHKFFRLGVTTLAYSDGHMQVMSAALLKPGDVALIISNSGRTRDLIDATDIARKHGATTIAITATRSPLALTSDIHLAADHTERYDQDIPMTSRLVHLLMIDILATCLALRIGCVQGVVDNLESLTQRRICTEIENVLPDHAQEWLYGLVGFKWSSRHNCQSALFGSYSPATDRCSNHGNAMLCQQCFNFLCDRRPCSGQIHHDLHRITQSDFRSHICHDARHWQTQEHHFNR